MIKRPMTRFLFILLLLFPLSLITGQDSLRFSGQLSSWANASTGSDLPLWGGIRYIPQINFGIPSGRQGKFDSEFSANIFGSAGVHPFDSLTASGNLKPYRAWIRYTTNHLEIRLGLQKLNFGSASMLRPLMWFDQMDPSDPLQLTDGVWGLLTRYYFLNNSSVWLWGLYGNKARRGWELVPSNSKIPEFGGRVQVPVPRGEAAISYHHRTEKGHVYRSMIIESVMIGIIGSVFGTILGLSCAWLVQEYGINISGMMQGSAMLMPEVIRARITPPDFYIGFLPGIAATVIGTMLSGIGIYKRQTARLFKELEA